MIRRLFSPRRGIIADLPLPRPVVAPWRPTVAEAEQTIHDVRVAVLSLPEWVPTDLVAPILQPGGLVDRMRSMLLDVAHPADAVLLDVERRAA